jgi:uncharacterized Ntn-hydrolase superfamily protein
MTFSIAALCARTGEYGCALATSSMAVGGRAVFVVPEVGVVVSQARTDPRLGTLGIECLRRGQTPEQTIAEMMKAAGANARWRQLAVVDLKGRVAGFTGDGTTEAKGLKAGKGAIAFGNGLANERVVPAILEGYERAPDKPLTERLFMALESGLAAGGEAFPLRSSAIRVARPGVPMAPVDLRIDFSPTPIEDLVKLWPLWSPMIDGYMTRCVDPANSPPASEIEGHLR